MKKLLSLLSVLTISGTSLPTVIAASPYQNKITSIINDDLKTNNLETLNRSKRNSNLNKIEWEIKKNPEDNNFLILINDTVKFLRNRNIIVSTTSNSEGSSSRPYAINPNLNNNDNNIFIISVSIRDSVINLVFRSRDLYLQGYGITIERDITRYLVFHNHETVSRYYYFSDSTTRSIPGYEPENLGFNSSYISLVPKNHSVSWSQMYESFINLIDFQGNRNNINGNITIEGSLTNIILFTSESLRFNSIRNLINERFFSNIGMTQEGYRLTQNYSINWNDDNISNIVNNWNTNSNEFYDRIKSLTNFFRELPNQISILSAPGALAFFNYCIRDYGNGNYNKRIRRDLNNNEICSSTNNLTPVYNYNDFFQVIYCFICHNDIKINLTKNTAIKIKEVFYLKNKVTFKKYLISLFKKIRQIDETGRVLGGILDSDYEVAANFIWEHFSFFNEKLCDLINSNYYNYISIETDRGEKWKNIKLV